MGCWNETCGVTQMPIMSGDPVALLLLDRMADIYPDTHKDAGHCYPADIWAPIGTPIYGAYNDYGSLEDIQEDWNTKFLIERLKTGIAEKPAGNSTVHDLAVVAADLTVDHLLELIHESRVTIRENGIRFLPSGGAQGTNVEQRIGFMMVHRPIWDLLTSKIDNWGSVTALSQIIEEGIDYYENSLTKIKETGVGADAFEVATILLRLREHLESKNGRLNRFCTIGDGSRTCLRAYRDRLHDLIEAHAITGERDTNVATMIEEMARFMSFDVNMLRLRKTYMPQAGKGSQDQSYDLIREIHSVCEDIMRENEREWGDEDEGDAA